MTGVARSPLEPLVASWYGTRASSLSLKKHGKLFVMRPAVLEYIESKQLRKDITEFRTGDTVRVHWKVKEGEKERVQPFEGVVIRKTKGDNRASFTVRKMSYGCWRGSAFSPSTAHGTSALKCSPEARSIATVSSTSETSRVALPAWMCREQEMEVEAAPAAQPSSGARRAQGKEAQGAPRLPKKLKAGLTNIDSVHAVDRACAAGRSRFFAERPFAGEDRILGPQGPPPARSRHWRASSASCAFQTVAARKPSFLPPALKRAAWVSSSRAMIHRCTGWRGSWEASGALHRLNPQRVRGFDLISNDPAEIAQFLRSTVGFPDKAIFEQLLSGSTANHFPRVVRKVKPRSPKRPRQGYQGVGRPKRMGGAFRQHAHRGSRHATEGAGAGA